VGATIGIGSLPHEDVDDALCHLGVPMWSLPTVGRAAPMTRRYLCEPSAGKASRARAAPGHRCRSVVSTQASVMT
jgi:hypothetical protein